MGDLYGHPSQYTPQNRLSSTTGFTLGFYMLKMLLLVSCSQVGIVLCLHGCPLETKGMETGVRESTALYYAMQERLIGRFPLISPGWMNHPVPGKWTTPDVDQAAKNLIGLGAQALVFAPIGFVTERSGGDRPPVHAERTPRAARDGRKLGAPSDRRTASRSRRDSVTPVG